MFSVNRHDRSVRTIVLAAAFSLVLVNLLSETQSTELRFGVWALAVEKQDVASSSLSDKSAGRSNSRNRHYKPPPMLDGRRLSWDEQPARQLPTPMSLLFKDTTLSTTTSPLETTTRIINGAKVPNRDNYVFSAGSQLCGGTLIHEDIVLTAAHCKGVFLDGALLGGTKIDGSESEVIDVAVEFPHPGYDAGKTENNDIMLVQLASPAPSSVPLQQLNFNPTFPPDDSKVSAIGFGNTADGGTASFDLLGVDLQKASFTECNKYYGFITDVTMVCAKSDEGKDTCQGDSGGPLYSGNVQVGIVSFGDGCGAAGVPSVYARVSGFQDFIIEGICDLSANPPKSCFPTDAPVGANKQPTKAPVKQPTKAPVKAPTNAPAPTKKPSKAPTGSPITFGPSSAPGSFGPTIGPVSFGPSTVPLEPTKAPVAVPVAAPVTAPVAAPVQAPVAAPVTAPVTSPVATPVAAPVQAPVQAPVSAPVVAPVSAPVAAPIQAPVASPVAAPAVTPLVAPVAAPVPPVTAPVVTAPVQTPAARPPTVAPTKGSIALDKTASPTPGRQNDGPTVVVTPVIPALPTVVVAPVIPALPTAVTRPIAPVLGGGGGKEKGEKGKSKDKNEKSSGGGMKDVMDSVRVTTGPSPSVPITPTATAPPSPAELPTIRLDDAPIPPSSSSSGNSKSSKKSKSEKKEKKGEDDDDDDGLVASDRARDDFWTLWNQLTGDERNKEFDIDGIPPVVPKKYHQVLNQWVEVRLAQQRKTQETDEKGKSASKSASKSSKKETKTETSKGTSRRRRQQRRRTV